RLRYFNVTYAARRDECGVVSGIMILGAEVTEQVIARQRLRESQERYRQLFDHSPLPKWIFDPKTFQFIDVNLAAVDLYGYSKEEFLAMKVTQIQRPEGIDAFMKAMNRDWSTGVQTSG